MATYLGLAAIVLVLIIFFQVGKLGEVADTLRDEEKAEMRNNNLQATLFLITLILGMGAIIWSAFYYSGMYLPEPSSEHGMWIRSMFFWTLVSTVPVFILTHILLFGFAYQYKGEKSKLGYYFPENHKLELIWTLVPAVVMIGLVTVGIYYWNVIFEPAKPDAIVIEATAQQFKWDLRYAGQDNKLGEKRVRLIDLENNPWGQNWNDATNKDDFSADTLRLPLGKEVLVKINALDVLHNFYLPHFRVKMDAVPGIPTQFKFTPTKTTKQMREELGQPDFHYELACAELCGKSHYNMRKVVVVDTEEDFNKWLKEQKPISETFKPSNAGFDVEWEKNEEEVKDIAMNGINK